MRLASLELGPSDDAGIAGGRAWSLNFGAVEQEGNHVGRAAVEVLPDAKRRVDGTSSVCPSIIMLPMPARIEPIPGGGLRVAS